MEFSITNREYLKDAVHDIHNMLRNNGAGYGMNALKIFLLFYGLKKIEDFNIYQKYIFRCYLCENCKNINNEEDNDDNKCKSALFSHILEISNELNNYEFKEFIYRNVLDALYSLKDTNMNLFNLLFYEIPKNISGKCIKELLKKINNISKIETKYNVQLTGKIYEYFIGRDQVAMKELGAYFTDRYIVSALYKFVEKYIILDKDKSFGSFIDPFGGSGGFSIEFINYINKKYSDKIDWKKEINNIYHCDLNEDVIKLAGLEMLCLTHNEPDMEKKCKMMNSFQYEYTVENILQKFRNIFTNPPYGGDKTKTTQEMIKRTKIIDEINKLLQQEDIQENVDLKKSLIKQANELNKANKDDKKQLDLSKVKVDNSSQRIQEFAKKFKLNGNDKEATSLILLMELLEKDGLCVGVLKEGVFFNQIYKTHRETLLRNFNVEAIISIPSDAFENTTTKTSALIFRNTKKKTEYVKFYNLDVPKYKDDKFELINDELVLTQNKDDIIDEEVKPILYAKVKVKHILKNKNISLDGRIYISVSENINNENLNNNSSDSDISDSDISDSDSSDSDSSDSNSSDNDSLDNSNDLSDNEIIDNNNENNNKFEYKKIKEISILKPKSNINTIYNDFKLVKIGDINNNTFTTTNIIKKDKVKKSNIAKNNDIILSNVRPKKEKLVYLNNIENIDNYCFTMPIIRPNKNMQFFIYYYLYNNLDNFENRFCSGTSYPSFNLDIIKDIEIPILKDEEKLNYYINEFEKYNNELYKLQKLIKDNEQKINELINNETNYEIIKLGDIANIKSGNHTTNKKDFIINGEYHVIGGGLLPICNHNIYNCNENTIICSGVGTPGIISLYPTKTFITCAFAIEEKKDLIDKIYLYYYLKNNRNIIINNSNGSTQKALNISILSNINIPLLNINIINNINLLHKDILSNKEKLEKLEKNNILTKFKEEFN